MKLRKGIDAVDLLQAVRRCSGEVLFKTDEGDTLNLKSALSSYVFCAALSSPDIVENGRIECSDPEDAGALLGFCEE